MATVAQFTSQTTCEPCSVLGKNGSIAAILPEKQLRPHTVQLRHAEHKLFMDWTEKDHGDAFDLLQKVVATWKAQGIAEQYLLYGKQCKSGDFAWEVIPYYKPYSCVGRIWQQLVVLWRVTFGGLVISESERRQQTSAYQALEKAEQLPHSSQVKDDPFCKESVIENQWVHKGDQVTVLFPNAPIGGLKGRHFLVIPVAHHEKFSDLPRGSFIEMARLSSKLVRNSLRSDPNQDVHFQLKTGRDAGQTVQHVHLHVTLIPSTTQDIWGRLTVLKNILFGSSTLKGDVLKNRVLELRTELQPVFAKDL